MHRNSSWVTLSVQKRWDSSFIRTQCSYILETCIRWLVTSRRRSTWCDRRERVGQRKVRKMNEMDNGKKENEGEQ